MIHFVQPILQWSQAADAILEQLDCEFKAQIAIISKPYRIKTSPSWFYDWLGTVALWILDSCGIQVLGHGSGDGFIWVRLRRVTVYSMYLSPNYSAQEYRERLEALEYSVKRVTGRVIVAGDLNATAVEWVMSVTNALRRRILEMAARLDIEVANRWTTPNYRRPGFSNSIPDVTLVSAGLFPLVADWG